MLSHDQIAAALKKAHGSDSPKIAIEDASIVLTYESAAALAPRCSADDAAIRKLAKVSEVAQSDVPATVAGVEIAQRVTYLLLSS